MFYDTIPENSSELFRSFYPLTRMRFEMGRCSSMTHLQYDERRHIFIEGENAFCKIFFDMFLDPIGESLPENPERIYRLFYDYLTIPKTYLYNEQLTDLFIEMKQWNANIIATDKHWHMLTNLSQIEQLVEIIFMMHKKSMA